LIAALWGLHAQPGPLGDRAWRVALVQSFVGSLVSMLTPHQAVKDYAAKLAKKRAKAEKAVGA